MRLPQAIYAGMVVGPLFDFVSGSWVFISGLIVIFYYGDRFDRNRPGTARRLWVRGFKILALFLVLNLSISFLGMSGQQNGG